MEITSIRKEKNRKPSIRRFFDENTDCKLKKTGFQLYYNEKKKGVSVFMNEESEFRLECPREDLLDQYLEFCRESWDQVHDNYILSDPAQYGKWRHTLLEKYRREEQGIGLQPGIVPSVTFWILREGRMIGIANYRPKLNAQLENYGGHLGIAIRPSERGKGFGRALCPLLAAKARELGIRQMLLTSEADNPAGIRCSECFPASRHEYRDGFVNGKWCRTHRTIVDLTDPAYHSN